MYSDPMPGENLEAQKEAKEGAIENPYYNPAFENMEGDVAAPQEMPGEMPQETPADTALETPAETPLEAPVEPSNEKKDGDNAIAKEFNESWSVGKAPNLENIKQSVEQDYIGGAIEEASTNAGVQADISTAERGATDTPDAGLPAANADQPHDISLAAATEAIGASAKADEIVDGVRSGDVDATMQISDVEQRAAQATELANKIQTAAANNAEGSLEAQQAISVANQAREEAAEATKKIEDAQAEFNAMDDTEKAEAQEIAAAAEANGTTFEEEKQKVEEEKKTENAQQEQNPASNDENNVVLDRGMLG